MESSQTNKYDEIKGFSFMAVLATMSLKRTDAHNREDAADIAKFDAICDAMKAAADEQIEVFRLARKGEHFTITPKKP